MSGLLAGFLIKMASEGDDGRERRVGLEGVCAVEGFCASGAVYAELGFKLDWENDDLAEFEVGTFRFLLQKFYVKEHADNFMMHLLVEDADVWWARIEAAGLVEKYPGIMAKPPAVQSWGMRVLFLSDPTGVVWHIAERRPE